MTALLSTAEAANFLGVSDVTMVRWRKSGCGPAYTRPGRKDYLYDISELKSFKRIHEAERRAKLVAAYRSKGMTYEAISAEMGLSQARVAQLLAIAKQIDSGKSERMIRCSAQNSEGIQCRVRLNRRLAQGPEKNLCHRHAKIQGHRTTTNVGAGYGLPKTYEAEECPYCGALAMSRWTPESRRALNRAVFRICINCGKYEDRLL